MSRLEFFLNRHRPAAPKDRRVFNRIKPYWVQCDAGYVLDISADGVKILSKRRMKGFVSVRLWDDRAGLIHRAEVKWVKKLRFRQYEVGLQFINFGPEMRQKLAEIAARLHEM
ncbi:MAG: PilZ domain-containing protein [Phycisphaerales bacterium]|nr:PilZ domain-containing protein [Phycisphaerae bacterium]NNF41909.1 PilZ domain-containing protein [Phycisphaerales bacterium]NNM25525.1 PilZ domain-containing protein [Phycisphaerales bacterium]